MKNVNVCILQTEWPIWKTLKTYSKMTPGGKGIWQNLVGVDSIEKADLAIIIDYTIFDVPKGMPKVYMGAHPPPCPGYRCYDDKDAIAKFDLRDTYGFGEWWIDWNYDELMELKNPEKTKELSCILSNKTSMPEHLRRRVVATEFCTAYPNLMDLYGRIIPTSNEVVLNSHHKGPLGEHTSTFRANSDHTAGKTSALLPYKYSLEFDYYCDCKNYFSERFLDALLLWTMPIYSGGKGVHQFLPRESYIEIDSWTVKPDDIAKYIKSGYRDEHVKDIAQAREIILNELQMWARTYNAIKGKL